MKKISIITLTCYLLFFSILPVHAQAEESPTPPPPPAPSAPSDQPSSPSAPSTPSSPQSSPQPTDAPTTNTDTTTPSSSSTSDQIPSIIPSPSASSQNSQQTDPAWDPTIPVTPTPATTSLTTGNATANSIQATTGTTNSATPGNNTGSNNSTTAITAGNGADSTNTVSSTTSNTNSAIQTNTGSSVQTLSQSSVTGKNNASENVGDTATTTGDANVSGTIITAQNTNVDGVAVAEFTVADNHTGDIILDFGANCISGCNNTVPGEVVKNIGNGAGSTNTTSASSNTNTMTFQNNDGSVGNNLVLLANSGDNLSNRNTDGNTSIQTGDAHVSGNSLTFLNNNIAGNVVYGIVNIFGDLQGDIILPQSVLDTFNPCPNGCNTTLTNAGNGANTTNTTQTSETALNTLTQTNDAIIANNLQLSSTTGANQTTRNTGGTTTVTSGQASADSHVLNIANSNISGGNFWLVLINKAGQWIGQLLGAPDGSTMASSGLTLSTDPQGNVTATNNGNGSNSTNTAQSTQTSQNTVTQSNTATAHVGNTLNLSANTGNNTANENTGGNVDIQTGDAKILANIVNFVNDNIVGSGKLFVTIVNVFGKWVGDFVTPGHEKQNHTTTTQNNTQTTTSAGSVSQQTQIQQTTTTTSHNNPHPTDIPTGSDNPNTPNPVITSGNGTATNAVLGTIATAFQNSQKTTVAAIHTPPFKDTITINLAWLLLAIPPLTVALLIGKTWKRKKSTF